MFGVKDGNGRDGLGTMVGVVGWQRWGWLDGSGLGNLWITVSIYNLSWLTIIIGNG